jgi:16S rRNA processing protein RimM
VAGDPFTAVGRVVKAHGLAGEVSVLAYSDTPLDVLTGLEVWIVPPPASPRTTRIDSVRPGPKGPIVGLAAVNGIEEARALAGRELLVSTDALPETWTPTEDTGAACGLHVVDEVHGDLGEVSEVIVTGANDVWVVQGPFGEVLVPVIDEVVLSLDEQTGVARVRLLPGLLPDEADRP